jgi:signal peptidase
VVAATAGCAALAVAVVTLHLNVRPVLTSSMRPTYGPGAVVVTEPVPVTDLHPGMIVLFTPPGEHAQFAHRIVSVTGPRTAPIITTKGDANRYPDPWHAQLTSATVPRVVTSVPFVGRLMVGLRGSIQLILIVLGGLTVAATGARWILQPGRALVDLAS